MLGWCGAVWRGRGGRGQRSEGDGAGEGPNWRQVEEVGAPTPGVLWAAQAGAWVGGELHTWCLLPAAGLLGGVENSRMGGQPFTCRYHGTGESQCPVTLCVQGLGPVRDCQLHCSGREPRHR